MKVKSIKLSEKLTNKAALVQTSSKNAFLFEAGSQEVRANILLFSKKI